MKVRVLVADDHAIVRRGIVEILTEDPEIEVVSEADNGPDVLRLAREHELDVVVLDLNMPGPGGFSVLANLHAEHPGLAVLVVSIHDELQYGTRVMRAGAAGYLAKNAAPENLVAAVRRVATGRRYVSMQLAEALLDGLESPDDEPHKTLSDREFEVFVGLATGLTVSAMAETLSLSVKTVSTYRTRVLEKLSLRSNADLARYALSKGLIPDS